MHAGINAMNAAASPAGTAAPPRRGIVRCRRIVPQDERGLSLLLARGFPALSAAEWARALARIGTWHETQGLPAPGFLIEDGDVPVGVLLTIWGPGGTRCNLSSWYLEEGYRRYGQMLVSAALRDRSVTYLNVSAERHTWPIIEAQGFRRYTAGVVAALPLLAFARRGAAATEGDPPAGVAVDPAERLLMEQHRAMGCVALWGIRDGRAHPFVFARRTVRRLPVAQLVYCPQDTDWRPFAGAVGRALARHGLFILLADAEGPLPGLPGRFLPGRMPKYARGPAIPRCGDLAYTETAMFGT